MLQKGFDQLHHYLLIHNVHSGHLLNSNSIYFYRCVTFDPICIIYMLHMIPINTISSTLGLSSFSK